MDAIQLESEIRKKFIQLNNQLSSEEKKAYHFCSVENFVHHIFEENSEIEKKKLKKIHLAEHQKLLLEYLGLIKDEKVGTEDSVYLFHTYIEKIGLFMGNNFGFSYSGGKSKYLTYFIYTAVGAILDVLLSVLTDFKLWLFTFGFLLIGIIQVQVKNRKGRIYGLYY